MAIVIVIVIVNVIVINAIARTPRLAGRGAHELVMHVVDTWG